MKVFDVVALVNASVAVIVLPEPSVHNNRNEHVTVPMSFSFPGFHVRVVLFVLYNAPSCRWLCTSVPDGMVIVTVGEYSVAFKLFNVMSNVEGVPTVTSPAVILLMFKAYSVILYVIVILMYFNRRYPLFAPVFGG